MYLCAILCIFTIITRKTHILFLFVLLALSAEVCGQAFVRVPDPISEEEQKALQQKEEEEKARLNSEELREEEVRAEELLVTTNKPVVALRSNLLFDAFVLPNIGIEVGLPMNFTIGADWFGTWIKSDKRHLYWQGYGGYLTLRYYFGKEANEKPFTGHHVGIYGSILTYDIEFGGKGYQAAKPGFGGGIEYGYSLPVHPVLCIDFNIGLGFQGGEYKIYQPADDGTGHYVWRSTHKRRWWGPTKAEVSLKWLISPVKKKAKKGGDA